MNIILIGCGTVGNAICQGLVNEGHNVTVIDNNEDALTELCNSCDVTGLHGNGIDITTLRSAGASKADLLIAVTNEDEINLFVMHWVNAVEDTHQPCNSPMYVSLLSQFVFKHENFKIDLIENKKSFEQALCYLPKWVEYLTDMSVQYHNGYGEYDIFDLLISMHNAGYEKEQMETVLSAFLEELERVMPREARHLARNLPHYAEKEPWLNEYLPVFEQYLKVEETREETNPTFTFTPLNLEF